MNYSTNFAKTFMLLWHSFTMIVTLLTSDSLKITLNSSQSRDTCSTPYLGTLIPVIIIFFITDFIEDKARHFNWSMEIFLSEAIIIW